MMRISILIFFLLASFFSCIDILDISVPEDQAGRIAIVGSVERGPNNYLFQVSVRRTASNFDNAVFDLEEADIFLVMNGQVVLTLANSIPAKFDITAFHNEFGGNPEDARFLARVMLTNGRVFESEEQQILNRPLNSSLQVKLIEREKMNSVGNFVDAQYVELLVNANLQNADGNALSYLWEVSSVYRFRESSPDNPLGCDNICYVYQPPRPNDINVFNGADIDGETLDGYKIGETAADYRFESGYYYTVIQKVIDVSTAIYWEQVAASVRRDGTIFDTPPGRVKTNFHDLNDPSAEVLGYFYAAGIDTLRYMPSYEETGRQAHLCANIRFGACCDCLTEFLNSALQKPHYWP